MFGGAAGVSGYGEGLKFGTLPSKSPNIKAGSPLNYLRQRMQAILSKALEAFENHPLVIGSDCRKIGVCVAVVSGAVLFELLLCAMIVYSAPRGVIRL